MNQKLLIASDIHGSEYYCKRLFEVAEKENPDKIILLGDLLYHGPRNDLPKDYQPKRVIEILNAHKNELLCVRGNCDTEVDQMVLEFPILADYCILYVENKMIFATHGHHFNEEQLPPFAKGDILMHGHTHIPVLEKREDYTLINPGSVSIPKGGFPGTYLIYEQGMFTLKDLDQNELKTLTI